MAKDEDTAGRGRAVKYWGEGGKNKFHFQTFQIEGTLENDSSNSRIAN